MFMFRTNMWFSCTTICSILFYWYLEKCGLVIDEKSVIVMCTSEDLIIYSDMCLINDMWTVPYSYIHVGHYEVTCVSSI